MSSDVAFHPVDPETATSRFRPPPKPSSSLLQLFSTFQLHLTESGYQDVEKWNLIEPQHDHDYFALSMPDPAYMIDGLPRTTRHILGRTSTQASVTLSAIMAVVAQDKRYQDHRHAQPRAPFLSRAWATQEREITGERVHRKSGPKLNSSQVRAIKRELRDGATRRSVASRYNISMESVRHIAQGRTWTHVTLPEDR